MNDPSRAPGDHPRSALARILFWVALFLPIVCGLIVALIGSIYSDSSLGSSSAAVYLVLQMIAVALCSIYMAVYLALRLKFGLLAKIAMGIILFGILLTAELLASMFGCILASGQL